jgi:hypothetical protein
MERQQLLAIHLGQCKGSAVTSTHDRTIGRLSRPKFFGRHCHYALKITVNGVSIERPQLEVIHLGKSLCYASPMIYNRTTGRLSMQICLRKDCNHVPR